MNRASGISVLVLGIVLGVVGAIGRYAVTFTSSSFDIRDASGILLIVGVATAIVGLLITLLGGHSRTTETESVRTTPSGEVHTKDRSETGTAR